MRSLPPLCGLAAAALAACTGEIGTINIELVSAPDSELLSQVQSATLTLTNEGEVVSDDRSDGRISLEIELDAGNRSGALVFEGFDANGDLIARGESPPVPFAPIDATLSIYIAAPLSFDRAPIELPTPRDSMAGVPLNLGALIAGGQDEDGSTLAEVLIYNAFGHDFQMGADLPAPRASLLSAAGGAGAVYFFGGLDSEADPRSTLWRFDTTVAPAGAYAEVEAPSSFARGSGQIVDVVGFDRFLVTGGTPAILSGQGLELTEIPDTLTLVGAAVSLTEGETTAAVITGETVGPSGAVEFRTETISELSGSAELIRTGHTGVRLPDNSALYLGGQNAGAGLASAVRFRLSDNSFEVVEDLLSTPRTQAATTTTQRHLVVCGGVDDDGMVIGDAEVFSVPSLERVATLPLVVPRSGATAIPLPNNQVLLVGGRDADGNPSAVIELFTPGS